MMITPRRTGASVSRRVSLLDRQWFGHWSAVVITPVRLPTVDGVRAALGAFLARHPDQRLLARLDPAAGRWSMIHPIEIVDYLEHVVIPVDDPPPGGEEAFLAAHLPKVDESAPMVVLVGQRTLALYHRHALGDGNTTSRLLLALATGDFAGFASPGGRADLRVVMRETARRVVRRTLSRPASAAPSGIARAPIPLPTAAPVTPGSGFVRVRVSNDEYRRLVKWRNDAVPGVSLPSVLTSAIAIALRDGGVAVDTSGFHTLIDLRRYLSDRDKGRWGNLSKSLHLAVDITDPRAVDTAVAALLRSGWPLASTVYGAAYSAVARGAARAHRRGTSSPWASSPWAPPHPLALTVSIIPTLPSMDLPWIGAADERVYFASGFPAPPGALTIFAVRLRTHLEIAATFDSATMSPDRVRDALAMLKDAPRLLRREARPPVGPGVAVRAGDQP